MLGTLQVILRNTLPVSLLNLLRGMVKPVTAQHPCPIINSGSQRTNWLGTMAVWLSGISMLIYFLSSYAVSNYFVFLRDNFYKTLEILSK